MLPAHSHLPTGVGDSPVSPVGNIDQELPKLLRVLDEAKLSGMPVNEEFRVAYLKNWLPTMTKRRCGRGRSGIPRNS